jgi:hypothetical protein
MYPLYRIALLITLTVAVTSCEQSKNPSFDLVILQDDTDQSINLTSFDEIRKTFNFNDYLYSEYRVRVRRLTDIKNGPVSESILPSADNQEVPNNIRKQQVRQFLQMTRKMIQENENRIAKQQSLLFEGIAQELNRLANQSPSAKKVAIINSNLFENSGSFSVFNENDRSMLFNKPDSVKKKLMRLQPLDSLKGIKVFIVHRSSPSSDRLFNQMVKIYRDMLTEKGADVYVQANFVPHPYSIESAK